MVKKEKKEKLENLERKLERLRNLEKKIERVRNLKKDKLLNLQLNQRIAKVILLLKYLIAGPTKLM